MAEKIAIISGKGGVGKTTVTANLGSIASHVFGKNTIIIDTNVSSSHLGIHMGFHSNPATLSSVLQGEHDVRESIYEHETGVKVVPGALHYDSIKDIDVFDLDKVVEKFDKEADFIFLDCSPGLDRETAAALRAADRVLYVCRPSFTSVVDVLRTQSLVEDIGKEDVGVLLNMVRGKKHEIDAGEIESFTGLDVIGEIPYDEKMEKSASQGTPVTIMDPHCRASRALEDLATGLLDEDPSIRRSGLWRRFRELLPGL